MVAEVMGLVIDLVMAMMMADDNIGEVTGRVVICGWTLWLGSLGLHPILLDGEVRILTTTFPSLAVFACGTGSTS